MNAKAIDEPKVIRRLLQSRRTCDPARSSLLGVGVQNFQGITEPQFLAFANLTLVYGPNSAGKSAFLDLLDGLQANMQSEGLLNFSKLQRSASRYRGARAVERYVGSPDSMQFWIAVQSSSDSPPSTDAVDPPDFELRSFFQGRAYVVRYESQSDDSGDYWLKSAALWTNETAKHPLLEIRGYWPEDDEDYIGGDYKLRVWAPHPDLPILDKAWTDGAYSTGGDEVYADLVDNFETSDDDWLELIAVHLEHKLDLGVDIYCRFAGDMQGGDPRTEGEEAILKFLLAAFRLGFQIAAHASKHVASPAVRPIPTGRDATSILVNTTRRTMPVFEGRQETEKFAPWDWLAQDACFEAFSEDEGLLDYVNRIAAKESMLGLGYQVLADVHPLGQDVGARFFTSKSAKRTLTLPDTRKEHSQAVREKMGYLVRTLVQDDNSVRLGVDEVGTGVSQVIPVLVALYPGFSESVVQQPELHLHPRLQSAMADVLLDRLKRCPGGLTIVESHSEHLLLRVLRRLRDTSKEGASKVRLPITADQLAIFYADKREDGGTDLLELRVSEEGEFLDRWPHGFFTERDEDLDAFL